MKNILISLILLSFLSSCVSKNIYENLENKYNRLKNQNSSLVGENDTLFSNGKDLEMENQHLKKSMDSLASVKSILQDDVIALSAKKKYLEESYNDLSVSSASQLESKAKEILELSKALNEKETALILENTRLEKLKKELDARSDRIEQLKELIAAKETKMQSLKMAVSKALQNFEGKGLIVHQKNGKVYVSMDNKLLFNSGSWKVGSQGRSAVKELAKVLSQNKDIDVLIEGHTDNVPYSKNGSVEDNWDLSTKRATAIVRILVNNQVNPKQLTAAGKGEFLPLENNNDKAKNRRIEVILTPNLDNLNKLFSEK